MENGDKIAQQQVGAERGFLVEKRRGNIAGEDAPPTDRTELTVTGLLCQQPTEGQGLLRVIAQQPHVGVACFLEHGLEGQGQRAAPLVVGPGIAALGVLEHAADGAASARHIPHTAGLLVDEHRRAVGGLLRAPAQSLITAVDDGEERIGPARAVASGWIAPKSMLLATFATLALACLFGLTTLYYGGATLVLVGALSCVFCLLYSAGPIPLSRVGLGDALVIAFFGFVATAFTYYVQTARVTLDATLLGLGVGFAVDNILVANNYRDRDTDRASRKYTLIALFGERFGRYFYLANGLIVAALVAVVFWRRDALVSPLALACLVVYLAFHLQAWLTLSRVRAGVGLIKILALSSRNVVVLGVLLAFALAS